jgi:predicted acetyltransferase
MLHLRLELNDYLLNYGGHIGYSIAPSERKKGYGSIMLKEALHKARDFQLEKVLITCDDDNPGSYKVIENNQGIIENKIFYEATGKYVRRYWIAL